MTIETEKRTRRWPRLHLDVPIRVIVHGRSKTSVIVGRGNELNEGGITPPYSGLPIRIRGVVRNRKGYRYGMEFVAEDTHESEQVVRWRTMLGVMSTGSRPEESVSGT
ncbi:MAG: hypothetical protein DMG81_07130 [Acidobacteria bacterium]|nr:MAG: hypothetical protein DMG81_07130 [Acidobacteriota bacterium]